MGAWKCNFPPSPGRLVVWTNWVIEGGYTSINASLLAHSFEKNHPGGLLEGNVSDGVSLGGGVGKG